MIRTSPGAGIDAVQGRAGKGVEDAVAVAAAEVEHRGAAPTMDDHPVVSDGSGGRSCRRGAASRRAGHSTPFIHQVGDRKVHGGLREGGDGVGSPKYPSPRPGCKLPTHQLAYMSRKAFAFVRRGSETTARTSLLETNLSPVLDGRAVGKSRLWATSLATAPVVAEAGPVRTHRPNQLYKTNLSPVLNVSTVEETGVQGVDYYGHKRPFAFRSARMLASCSVSLSRWRRVSMLPAGWLGSSWRQPASPQPEASESGGVALRASTPATPRCNLLLNHALCGAFLHAPPVPPYGCTGHSSLASPPTPHALRSLGPPSLPPAEPVPALPTRQEVNML